MLIKPADDKSQRLQLLAELQHSDRLDGWQRQQLKDDLWNLRRGIQGEKDAAHYIDTHYKGNDNYAVLHDLRFVVDGDVAQIDHLIISRGLHYYLLETKNFNGNLSITATGEFSVTYDRQGTVGVPSPLEQSRRHGVILNKLLDQLDIRDRFGGARNMHHVVLMHPKATITRPDTKAFDTSMVIKADQFRSWHERFVEKKVGLFSAVASMANMRGSDTLRELAEKIVRQHRPADPLAMAEHLKPRVAATQPEPRPVRPAPVAKPAPPAVTAKPPTALPINVAAPVPAEPADAPVRKLVCATCQAKISYAEGKFCWNNARRFGGLQYCREHQAALT